MRLSGSELFSRVYARGGKKARGPLAIYRLANGTECSRWGLSISRRVGNAATRNRIKRLLRESIRLLQQALPAGYDHIIVIRPHDPRTLAEYQKLLKELCAGS